MKNKSLLIIFLILGLALIIFNCDAKKKVFNFNKDTYYNEPSPLGDKIWPEDQDNINHDGLNVSQWFRETSGIAIVLDNMLGYWLYDTYWKNEGNMNELYLAFIVYVEKMGWSVDYETVRDTYPNSYLAESVKSLMRSRGADVSFTFIRINDNYAYYCVNKYDKNSNIYSTRIYHLYKEIYYNYYEEPTLDLS